MDSLSLTLSACLFFLWLCVRVLSLRFSFSTIFQCCCCTGFWLSILINFWHCCCLAKLSVCQSKIFIVPIVLLFSLNNFYLVNIWIISHSLYVCLLRISKENQANELKNWKKIKKKKLYLEFEKKTTKRQSQSMMIMIMSNFLFVVVSNTKDFPIEETFHNKCVCEREKDFSTNIFQYKIEL